MMFSMPGKDLHHVHGTSWQCIARHPLSRNLVDDAVECRRANRVRQKVSCDLAADNEDWPLCRDQHTCYP